MNLKDKTVVGVSGFQDYKGLKLLLDQVTPHVWKVIYVDGIYDFFKLKSTESPFSTDGSRELCKEYDNVELIEYAGYQPDKRQKYADRAAELKADILIVLDTDEWVHPDWTDWDAFYKQLEEEVEKHGRFHRVWNIKLYIEKDYELALNAVTRETWGGGSGRIWYRPEELEYYAGVHYYVRKKDTKDPHERLMSTNKTIDQGVRFTTSSKLRSKEFKDARDKWAKAGMDHEERLINAYNWIVSKESKHTPLNQLFPLIALLDPYVNDARTSGIFREHDYADILSVRYDMKHPAQEVLSKVFKYFKNHSGYTHLVLHEGNINWTKEQFTTILKEIAKFDETVMSGFIYDRRTELPNFASADRNKITSCYPSTLEIQSFIKLYRQFTISVESIDNLGLTFIRNDIVKFIDNVDSEEFALPTVAKILTSKLRKLGCRQYVHLQCELEKVDLPCTELYDGIDLKLHIGKYE